MDKHIIGANFTVSAYELMNIPIDQIRGHVKSRLAHELATSLIESEMFSITEQTNITMGQPDKTFKVELVVSTREEYRELLKYKEHFESLNSIPRNY